MTDRDPGRCRRAVALYRRATALLPSGLRREFGDEMVALLEDRLADARTRVARTVVLAGAFADLARQTLSARRATRRRPSLRGVFEALGSDVAFGWRQLVKNRTTSAAAILSLAVAIGACTSAFMLIDALLLRPLPIAEPHRLLAVSYERNLAGDSSRWDSGSYTLFRRMRAALAGEAEVIAISPARARDLTYGTYQEMESAYLQRVSGEMFAAFGLRPVHGRLFTLRDDVTPGEHPYAVISEFYWAQRFGRDPGAVGQTFRMGTTEYEIVGVVEAPFVGVEPGVRADLFVPTMMGPNVDHILQNGLRTFVMLEPGVAVDSARDRLDAEWRRFEEDKSDVLARSGAELREQRRRASRLRLGSAAAGVSNLQREFGRPLAALAILVGLVLLISCANVANLVTAQSSARGRDLAVRVAIGARRSRLVQLALVENAMLAFLATTLGAVFATWAAPFVVDTLSPRAAPIRLDLVPDARMLAFSLVLALGVTLSFGMLPAFRSSSVSPSRALRAAGNRVTGHRSMAALVAVQVAFCFVVLFVAGLFTATFDGLESVNMGFSADGLLALDARAQPAQPISSWDEVAEQLRAVPGVAEVAMMGWPLLSGSSTNTEIAPAGQSVRSRELTELLCVTPGWVELMGIRLMEGRDLQPADQWPGVAIVNQAFAREHTAGGSPLGARFDQVGVDGQRTSFEVVGVVGNVRYLGLRDAAAPAAYMPCRGVDAEGAATTRSFASFMVRTTGPEPLALTPLLQNAAADAHQAFRIRGARTQVEIVDRHTIRERLLATLGVFFAAVAVLLAGIGLAGVLHYAVLQRRREIGIRVALGASPLNIARRVVSGVMTMVLAGLPIGLALGFAVVQSIESLLYGVEGTESAAVAVPVATILGLAMLASLPGVAQGLRVDPARTLRED